MNISYYGGCWPINIGNAFIDYGSIYTIKTAISSAQVYFSSELSRWFFDVNRKALHKSIDLAELIDADVMVVSGMVFCDDFIRIEGPVLEKLSKRGAKIVFNGCGCATYDETEKTHFQRFLKRIEVSGFISRDHYTYENYRACFSKSYDGIDCAFFLREAFNHAPLLIKDYVVYSFDSMKEPQIENSKIIFRTHHSCDQLFPDATQNRAILTLKARVPYIKIGYHKNTEKAEFKNDVTLISDIPDDYLNLYANAYAVYSDRVHACIASLSFGNFARLYSATPRADLFERVGAEKIRQELAMLDQDRINTEKEAQISFLSEILRV